MKIRSLSSAVVIAVLANVGSALAQEPSAIGAYKADVVKAIAAWASEETLLDAKLGLVITELKTYIPLKVKSSEARNKSQSTYDALVAEEKKLKDSKAPAKEIFDAENKAVPAEAAFRADKAKMTTSTRRLKNESRSSRT